MTEREMFTTMMIRFAGKENITIIINKNTGNTWVDVAFNDKSGIEATFDTTGQLIGLGYY